MFRSGIFVLGLAAGAFASPGDWNGVFTESMYGGNMNVCVSQVENGDHYGQAVLSTVGYMRGLIDSSTDQWTGNYYLIGDNAAKGAFVLDLTVSTTNSYTASWLQDGIETAMTSAGTQSSTTTPTDVMCLRTDKEYLTGNAPAFSYSGERVLFIFINFLTASQHIYMYNSRYL
jgi:hypothetical protein